jgi:hypothetical protein
MRASGDGIEHDPMNFSFSPSGPRRAPVFCSEGQSFEKPSMPHPGICILRFAGKKYPKAKLHAERRVFYSDRRHLA